jgi:hypothetical protein
MVYTNNISTAVSPPDYVHTDGGLVFPHAINIPTTPLEVRTFIHPNELLPSGGPQRTGHQAVVEGSVSFSDPMNLDDDWLSVWNNMGDPFTGDLIGFDEWSGPSDALGTVESLGTWPASNTDHL